MKNSLRGSILASVVAGGHYANSCWTVILAIHAWSLPIPDACGVDIMTTPHQPAKYGYLTVLKKKIDTNGTVQ